MNPFKRIMAILSFRRNPAARKEASMRVASRPPVEIVDHDGVREADPYAFEASHRRLAWMLRLSTATNVGLLAVSIVLASAISTLIPLQKVRMGLVRIEPRSDRSEKVDPASLVRVLPITPETPGFDLMMESFVRRYVRILLEIDTVSQDDRMQEANIHSDGDWWKRFIRDHLKEIQDAQKSGLNRSIVVESADLISRRDNIDRYAIDFVMTDKRDGKVTDTKKLRAYVAVTTQPQTVPTADEYENPLGIRVLDLVLKERGNS